MQISTVKTIRAPFSKSIYACNRSCRPSLGGRRKTGIGSGASKHERSRAKGEVFGVEALPHILPLTYPGLLVLSLASIQVKRYTNNCARQQQRQ